jgi:hypothetical protein
MCSGSALSVLHGTATPVEVYYCSSTADTTCQSLLLLLLLLPVERQLHQ